MDNPSLYDDFTDQVTNQQWRTDAAFAQRRLAGKCPFSLRKVIKEGKKGILLQRLEEVMNPEVKDKFSFDEVRLQVVFTNYYQVYYRIVIPFVFLASLPSFFLTTPKLQKKQHEGVYF